MPSLSEVFSRLRQASLSGPPLVFATGDCFSLVSSLGSLIRLAMALTILLAQAPLVLVEEVVDVLLIIVFQLQRWWWPWPTEVYLLSPGEPHY